MNETTMLSLPKDNLTNGKYRTESKTLQLCVIPNTEENRKAIRQINRLAKQQNSHFKLKVRYRCPKDGYHYGYGGDLRKKHANGIGIYIQSDLIDQYTNWYKEKYWINRETIADQKEEIELLKKEIESLKVKNDSQTAIEHFENACGDYMVENGKDSTYFRMCDMVESLTEDS